MRPYQQKAVASLTDAIERGRRRVILRAPTGAGKTRVARVIIDRCRGAGAAVVFVAPRSEILQQTSDELTAVGIEHVVLQANHPPEHKVVVASIATLVRRDVKPPEVCFIDECHLFLDAAKTIKEVFPDSILIGLTATPERLDGRGLGEIYEEIIPVAETAELIEGGFLVPARVFQPSSPNLAGVRTTAGDYNRKDLAPVMDTATVVGDVVATWRRLAAGRSTLVYAVSVEASEHLASAFRAAGVNAAHVDAETPHDLRKSVTDRLRAGDLTVLCNCELMTYGLDVPRVSCISMARPTKSLALYLQMCLDEETEILTEAGWKTHENISSDDLVAAVDLRSSTEQPVIWWEPILSSVHRRLNQEEFMVGMNTNTIDFRVTDQHDLVASTDMGWRKFAASDFCGRPKKDFRFLVAGVQKAYGIPLTDDEIRFLGWFVTDGSWNKRNNTITITQSEHQPQRKNLEDCLRGCRFKFGISVVSGGGFKETSPRYRYRISRGTPRKTGKHLRGWGALAPFIDKDLSPRLENMTTAQFDIFIEAAHLGDGVKMRNRSWTRRGYSISTGNKKFADRLQSLAIRRGYRCNLSVYNYNAKPLYSLMLKKRCWRHVGKGESRQHPSVLNRTPLEKVWCVENRLGTLITRRNGKTLVVGNCGRSLRTFPGKRDSLILDHAGNVYRHDMPDAMHEWSLDGVERRGDRPPSLRTCTECLAIYPPSLPACPECGAIPEKKPREVEQRAGELVEAKPTKWTMMPEYARVRAYSKWLRTKSSERQAFAIFCAVFKTPPSKRIQEEARRLNAGESLFT